MFYARDTLYRIIIVMEVAVMTKYTRSTACGARRRRPLPFGCWPPPSRVAATADTDGARTRTYTLSVTPSEPSEQRYHGEAAAPDRRGDPVLLWWQPDRCCTRSQQIVRTHARQKEYRYAICSLIFFSFLFFFFNSSIT